VIPGHETTLGTPSPAAAVPMVSLAHPPRPDGLLSAWSAAIEEEPRRRRLGHRATRDAMTFLHDVLASTLDNATKWALSGWAGAEADVLTA
jgi:hypothetical protein